MVTPAEDESGSVVDVPMAMAERDSDETGGKEPWSETEAGGWLEGRVSKLELLLAQKDQRINHLEEKVEKLVHKLESAITPALTLLVKRARREGSTELATIG